MAPFCLIKSKADKFKQMLKSGKISPDKLYSMTSEERRSFFSENFGEREGKEINTLYETKLLLKNQKRAIISFAKSVMKDKPSIRDLSAITRINKLNKALTEQEIDTYLEDLTEKKVGFQISEQEFKDLSTLAETASNKKEVAVEKLKDGKWESEADRKKYGMDFGISKVAYDTYYTELANRAKGKAIGNIREAFKNRGMIKGTGVLTSELFNFVAENSRALVASWDNSFWGRQGRKAATRPATSRLWFKNFITSFGDARNTLIKGKKKGDDIIEAAKADIYSRENYLNGNYMRGAKLDIGIREEEFPTSFPEKIPALGRLFKMSEVTYQVGAMRLRADIADTFYKMAEAEGQNLNDNEVIGSINDVVNVMTGRGTLGSFTNAGETLNKVFFSAKFAASQIQAVTRPIAPQRLGGAKSTFARKQAAYNLLSLVASAGIIMAMMSLLWKDRVELDDTSTNFGKIKIGNNWIDLTGGFGSYFVLAERIRRQQMKNTYTGVISKFNEGFGSQDGTGAIWDFIENKTSPMASIMKDLIKQKTFSGDKPTIFNETTSLIIPIIAETGYEAKKNSTADMLTAVIADGLGFSVSDYIFNTNWNTNTSKELTKFKEGIDNKTFKEANEEYNNRVSRMYLELSGDEKYQKMNNDERKNELTKRKKKIKDEVIIEYNKKSNKIKASNLITELNKKNK